MKQSSKQLGFSLIELIVSLAVFASVVTISIGALLVLVATNDQLQGEQSIMTNLSFALDSMAREIRTGTNYYCIALPSTIADVFEGEFNIFFDGGDMDNPEDWAGFSEFDCENGNDWDFDYQGLSFIESGGSITGATGVERISYFFDTGNGKLFRRISGQDRSSVVADDIFIHRGEFFVTGSEPLSDGEVTQAVVTIFIEASEDENTPEEDRYRLQTTVTQRVLDL